MAVEFGAVDGAFIGVFAACVVAAILGVVAWIGFAYGEAKGKLSKAKQLDRSRQREISRLESEIEDCEALTEGDDE